MAYKKLTRWRYKWYRYVANELLELVTDLHKQVASQESVIYHLEFQIHLEKQKALEWESRAKALDHEVDTQSIGEHINPCILSAHARASKQRIRELEAEVSYLRRQLHEKN